MKGRLAYFMISWNFLTETAQKHRICCKFFQKIFIQISAISIISKIVENFCSVVRIQSKRKISLKIGTCICVAILKNIQNCCSGKIILRLTHASQFLYLRKFYCFGFSLILRFYLMISNWFFSFNSLISFLKISG